MKTQRILLADSNTLFRNALIAVLNVNNEGNETGEFEIVQSVSNGAEVVKASAKESFDLILMDPDLPGMNGYEAAKRILLDRPEQKILVFTTINLPAYLRKSIDLGLHGHLTKNCSIEDLRSAIITVLSGKKLYDSNLMLKLMDKENNTDKGSVLTKHELVLLKQVCQEKNTAQIAQFLGFAVRTVEKQLLILFGKTGTKTKVGLAMFAMRNGLA